MTQTQFPMEAPASFKQAVLGRLANPLANKARLGLWQDPVMAAKWLEQGVPAALQRALVDVILRHERSLSEEAVAALTDEGALRRAFESGRESSAFLHNPYLPPDLLATYHQRPKRAGFDDRLKGTDREETVATLARRRNVENLHRDLYRLGPAPDVDAALLKAGKALTKAGVYEDERKSWSTDRFDYNTAAYHLTPKAITWFVQVPLYSRGAPVQWSFLMSMANESDAGRAEWWNDDAPSLGHAVDEAYAKLTALATEADEARFRVLLDLALRWMGSGTAQELALCNRKHVGIALEAIDIKDAAQESLWPSTWLNVLRHDPSLLAKFEVPPSGIKELVIRDAMPVECAHHLSDEQLQELVA
jgi:hypothetical protein